MYPQYIIYPIYVPQQRHIDQIKDRITNVSIQSPYLHDDLGRKMYPTDVCINSYHPLQNLFTFTQILYFTLPIASYLFVFPSLLSFIYCVVRVLSLSICLQLINFLFTLLHLRLMLRRDKRE